jgi:hypothetical protein
MYHTPLFCLMIQIALATSFNAPLLVVILTRSPLERSNAWCWVLQGSSSDSGIDHMMWRCCCCKGQFENSVGFVVQDDWSSRLFDRSCYTCHWFSFRTLDGANMCSECSDIPCQEHAPAFAGSVALEHLLHSRRTHNIPYNAPVSQKEHEVSQAIEQKKLQDYASCRSNEAMQMEDNVDMEPTIVERTVMDYAKNNAFSSRNASSKRSMSEVPEDARGRCVGCHVPLEICLTYCQPCFVMSPEGRAKRARMCVG